MIIKKTIILIFVLLPLFGLAQKSKKLSKTAKNALALYEREFGNESPAFEVSELPEEYKEESSVVLAKKVHMVFGRNRKGKNASQIATRLRIFLNDQAAVNEYSEFYYQKSDVVGISVVKPDGKAHEVDMNQAIEVTTEVPRTYRDQYHYDDYYKVAIPNLEIGDIIDFFKVFSKKEEYRREFVIPVISLTPTLHQELSVDTDKYWTVYYGSLNGAPDFTVATGQGYNMKGKAKKEIHRLKFEYQKAEGKEWERWADIGDEIPIIKLMAAPIKSSMHQKATLVEGLDPVDYMIKNLESVNKISKSIEKNLSDYIKGLKLKDIDESDAAEMVYRGLRSLLLQSMIQSPALNEKDLSIEISRNSLTVSDAVFANIFARIMHDARISCDMVVARVAPGSENDFLVGEELLLGVYIPKTEKYYWPFDNFSRPGEVPYYLEDKTVTRIPYSKIFKKNASQFIQKDRLPKSKMIDNEFKITADVSINTDNSLKYVGELEMKSYFREVYSPLFLFNTNHLDEDMKFSEVNKLFYRFDYSYFKGEPELINRTSEEFKEYQKIKDEQVKHWLEQEYNSLEVVDFFIKDNGMMNLDKLLKVAYIFKSESLIKKAGPNLIFEIGLLSGSQLELGRDELENRSSDIILECPKLVSSEISIELPESYSVHGLEDLNVTLENDAGAFISKASLEGKTIKISTSKEYRTNSLTSDQWPSMVAFLEAAYEHTQKKIILKKKRS